MSWALRLSFDRPYTAEVQNAGGQTVVMLEFLGQDAASAAWKACKVELVEINPVIQARITDGVAEPSLDEHVKIIRSADE